MILTKSEIATIESNSLNETYPKNIRGTAIIVNIISPTPHANKVLNQILFRSNNLSNLDNT